MRFLSRSASRRQIPPQRLRPAQDQIEKVGKRGSKSRKRNLDDGDESVKQVDGRSERKRTESIILLHEGPEKLGALKGLDSGVLERCRSMVFVQEGPREHGGAYFGEDSCWDTSWIGDVTIGVL